MAEQQPKDSESFFRKVVRFVANPATDWTELNSRQDADARDLEFQKSELKAMIERKRRNDFVRKREFDMLRKVRREGLTSEQLAALGGSSRLDDSEARSIDNNSGGARPDTGVKAKIDEIEQQMVGDHYANTSNRRTPEFYNAPTEPAAMEMPRGAQRATTAQVPLDGGRVEDFIAERANTAVPAAPSAAVMSGGMSPLSAIKLNDAAVEFGNAFAVDVSDVAHDPDLDEAVIAFANADF